MLAIVRFDAPGDAEEFIAQGQRALAALGQCVGHRDGWLARSTDDPGAWVLCTVWDSVGAYRRALSAYDVKMHATPFMYLARDEPTGFEPVLHIKDGVVVRRDTDLASDAASTSIGDFGPRSKSGHHTKPSPPPERRIGRKIP